MSFDEEFLRNKLKNSTTLDSTYSVGSGATGRLERE